MTSSEIDYVNESYTRIYNNWSAEEEYVGWQARSLLWHLRTKMAQSGVFRFGALPMVPLIVSRSGFPAEVVTECIPKLLEVGLLILSDGCLVDPRHVEAQTASKSNKQRQREFRDRHRDVALNSSPPPPTTGDLFAQDRNGSLRVTDVTPGKAEHSEGIGSDLSSEISDARVATPEPEPAPEPACEVSTPLRCSSESTPPVGPPLRFWRLYEASAGFSRGELGVPGKQFNACVKLSGVAAKEAGSDAGEDFDRAAQRILDAWWADDWVAERKPNLSHLDANIQKYAGKRLRLVTKPVAKAGFHPSVPTPQDELDRLAENNPDWVKEAL